ncbi:MAG: DNA polymerase I [Bacteroidia bacterium]|nr:DNA polymerase I [Bacteroidia bacterium]
MSNDQPKKLFLLDAFALIFRAHYAFINNPRVNSKGLNTSAIFGFTNTLLEVLRKEKPSHIAVVFDTSAPTERHIDYVEYKAQREEMPDELAQQIPYIFKLLEGFNIPALKLDGFEADDLIGTLAKKAKAQGFVTYMMTPDKDFGQLVEEDIFIFKPARSGNAAEIMGVKEVCEKWGIENVMQLIDVLGMMGDAVDNIPGIKGVGEKTAVNLIKEFGSMENMLANTDKLKGKLKEKVENSREMAILSKKLATIILNVPIELNEHEVVVKEVNKEFLRELFEELEFKRLAENLLGDPLPLKTEGKPVSQTGQIGLFDEEANATGASVKYEKGETDEEEVKTNYQTIETVEHNYILCDTKEKRAELIKKLSASTEFSYDSETTGLNVHEVEAVGLSFSIHDHEGYYIPLPEDQAEAKKIIEEFKIIFDDEKKTLIGQNIKFDLQILKNYDIEIKNKMFDTMVAHFLIKPEMRHNMNILSETYLNYSPVSIDTLIGKKKAEQISMRDVPVEKIKEYASEDADVTLQLKTVFAPQLKETEVDKLFYEVEVPLVGVLANMEREGINLDIESLKIFSAELEIEIKTTEDEIQGLAGTKFNVSSPKQVGEILFEYLKIIEKPKKTKTGQYATGEDVMVKLADKHPIVNKILDYRELVKLKSTYVDAIPLLINSKTKKIHTTYNQVVAVTGRLSSDNPNLQNIPIRTERGRSIRKAFIPRSAEFVLMSADYSQIELRIVASMSNDKNMCQAFIDGKDIHLATAAKVFGVNEADVTKEMRYKAKSVNFGIIYGQGPFGLAENIGVSRTEAKELIDNYFATYPGLKKYMDETVNTARETGYVKTLLGRRRYLRDINSKSSAERSYAERNAVNAPIQGTAADMIKVAMISIDHEMRKRNMKSKMLLQVHDELVFDAHTSEIDELKILVEKNMQDALPLSVPIEVGIGTGKNWLEAH